MILKKLHLKDFRNYKSAEMVFNSPRVVLIGKNGQGKTNLLESVFFVGMLRSFRTAQIADLKRIGSSGFYIGAEIEKKKWTEKLEIDYHYQGSLGKRKLFIDKTPVSKASNFIKQIKTVVFSPDDMHIVTGSSGRRRQFMDMLISVAEQEYLNALHNYATGFKSRNMAIRKNGAFNKEAKAFEPGMADSAVFIMERRRYYGELLAAEINSLLDSFASENHKFSISYRADCASSDRLAYLDRFDKERERDSTRGFTGFGPQQDDFDLIFQNKIMRKYASAGQSRLISLCMKIANMNIFLKINNDENTDILALVDDVTGELDIETRRKFLGMIEGAGQTIFTFTEKPEDEFFSGAEIYKLADGKFYSAG